MKLLEVWEGGYIVRDDNEQISYIINKLTTDKEKSEIQKRSVELILSEIKGIIVREPEKKSEEVEKLLIKRKTLLILISDAGFSDKQKIGRRLDQTNSELFKLTGNPIYKKR